MLTLHRGRMLTSLRTLAFGVKTTKIANVYQRRKYYAKYPHLYKQRTVMRPPDLTKSEIDFPINIPIRYRHIYSPKPPLFIDNTKKVHWNRLSPNEILLGLSNFKYMEFYEVVEGLTILSKVKGQEQHDWNQHPWVKGALDYVLQNFNHIRKVDIPKFYNLMKTLNYQHPQFWTKMYAKIQYNLYDLYHSFFQKIFVTYYTQYEKYFSSEMREKILKLMENRLRQFRPSSILYIFQAFMEENKLNTYWLQSVFIPLFKNPAYPYKPRQVAKIFQLMMMIGHENNSRLYDSLYNRVMKLNFTDVEEVTILVDVLQEVKEIFKSHRVQPYLTHLQTQKGAVIQQSKLVKKNLHEIVKEDLTYFIKKRQIKQQETNNLL